MADKIGGPDGNGRQSVEAILNRLGHLHPKVIDLSLGRIETLLAKLGNPQDKLPPVLHVAGTNGKGSTVATARAIAEAAGLRVHVYISPHLVHFNERIRLAGKLIEEGALTALLEEVEAANGDNPITFFEITTAAAFLGFSRVDADLTILEVGLGGRLDATNVIKHPALCAITPVSLDHQSYLGDDLKDIAYEKAGIIKPGAPVICGPQADAAMRVINQVCADKNVRLHAFGRQWRAGLRNGEDGEARLVYKDDRGILDLPAPVLVGAHQAGNAGIAIAMLRHQNAVTISDAAIRAGLGWVRWPARLQRLTHGPLFDKLPANSELWLDGGHNPSAARALREALLTMSDGTRPVIAIIGMMGNRDPADFLIPLQGVVQTVYGVTIPGVDHPCPAADIAAAAGKAGMQGLMASDVGSALDAISQSRVQDPPLVLIGGSLYLAGDVLAKNGPLPD